MSRRRAQARAEQGRSVQASAQAPPVAFRAGCGREWRGPGGEAELAYTDQAFPECPTCRHRVEPEGAAPFCTLRPLGTPHPFAALAGLQLTE